MSMPACADNAPKDRQILHLEKVIDDGTILASGKTISFRGITPVEKDNPWSYPAQLFLETMLVKFQQRYQMRHRNLRLEGSL